MKHPHPPADGRRRLTPDLAAEICETYTGRDAKTAQVHPDPHVAGTFAIQADISGLGRRQFLLQGWPFKTVEDAVAALEEVEFASWPPTTIGGGR